MESKKDEKKTKIGFVDMEDEGEMEMERQMEALARRRHTGVRLNDADDEPSDVAQPQQPFSGYRYMTPIELSDDEPVTSWTITRTFQEDTGIHGVEHIGHAIGKSH